MIKSKKDFNLVVRMYKELITLGEGEKCYHKGGICACGRYDLLEDARAMIEKSAVSLGMVERKRKG